jgi:hypothetical protein
MFFEADIYQSPGDMGSIDAIVDPGAPQQAVLSIWKQVKNAARLATTKNAGFNQPGLMFMQHDAAALSLIKDSVSVYIRNDIPLKLRI